MTTPNSTPFRAWGFDINRITANLDDYLFGHIQRADEEDWSEERSLFRDRFHRNKENPDLIVADLLTPPKGTHLSERREQIEKVVMKLQNGPGNDVDSGSCRCDLVEHYPCHRYSDN
jgi:hypothetical protein